MKAYLFAIGAMVLSWHAACAEALVWEKTRVELKPGPNDTEAIAYFSFTNKGTQPVEIKSATSSCSACTDFVWEEKSYKPGDEGQLIVTVDLKGVNGSVTRILTVTTTEPSPAKPQRLELAIDLPEKLTLSSRSAKWESGSKDLKIVAVTTAIPDAEPYIKEVRPEGLFSVALVKSPNTAKGHQIELTPVGDIAQARRALVKVGVRDAGGTEYLSTITATRR